MRQTYREYPPFASLAGAVECFWAAETPDSETTNRVLPDGCADILFSSSGSSGSQLRVIGTMTCYADFRLPPAQRMLGVRFHPGMWPAFLCAAGQQLTDRTLALEDLWGSAAGSLKEELENSESTPLAIAAFERRLKTLAKENRLDQTWKWLRLTGGEVRLDEIAAAFGNLSSRQFRRLCLEQTGLTLKRLCRVLRFRRAYSHRGSSVNWAGVAAECGYTIRPT